MSDLASGPIYWLLWVIVWIAPGLVTALIAKQKGRSTWLWLALGVVLSWLALITIIILPDTSGTPDVSVDAWQHRKEAEERAEADDTDS